MTQIYHPIREQRPAFSIVSILAIIAAVLSFFSGAGLGIVLALAAILLGFVGILLAFSPGVRGGVTSVISIVAGAIGIIVAILRLLF